MTLNVFSDIKEEWPVLKSEVGWRGVVGIRSQTVGSWGRKHGREKVTLTGRAGAALCKSASQLSRDTHRQSERAERGHERCHLIIVFGSSTHKDRGLTRPARKKALGRAINK